MEDIVQTLRNYRIAGMQQNLRRGKIPMVDFGDKTPNGWAIFLGVGLCSLVLLLTIFIWIDKENAFSLALKWAIYFGFWAALLYYVAPILVIIIFTISQRRLPARTIFEEFSVGQKFACCGLISAVLIYLLNHLFSYIWQALTLQIKASWNEVYLVSFWKILTVWLLTTGLLSKLIPLFLPLTSQLQLAKKPFKGPTSPDSQPSHEIPFGLWLGRSTGTLAKLWHKAGLAPRINVVLNEEDAAQNILVLGGIGAGKTTRLMQPLLTQLLEQGVGGLLFDVKGDVKSTSLKLAEKTNREIIIIGPSNVKFNLLYGLTPEVAASFFKSSLLLSSGIQLDNFWLDTATELCRNTLGLLSFLPEHYSLQGLYGYLFDEEFAETIQLQLRPLSTSLPTTEQRLIKSYLNYHKTIFSKFDEKVKSGVNATIAQALSPFNHPQLTDAFCDTSSASCNMEQVLNGTIYLVDLPLATWGIGSKVAYTFIKLRFFNLMQTRNQRDAQQALPVFFMCDEYQELVSANKDGLSDLNFWDKARSSKTIGIISAQSISSFYAALGNRDLAHALLQNFRQKLCFRTEDQATINMLDNLAGRAIVLRKSTSKTKGQSGFFEKPSSHSSTTENITQLREAVLDPALFRSLGPNNAIAILSLKGQGMDDVLELQPVFI